MGSHTHSQGESSLVQRFEGSGGVARDITPHEKGGWISQLWSR